LGWREKKMGMFEEEEIEEEKRRKNYAWDGAW